MYALDGSDTAAEDMGDSSSSSSSASSTEDAATESTPPPPKEVKKDTPKPSSSGDDGDDDWGSFYDPNNVFCGKYDCYKILGFDHESWGAAPPSLKDITKSYRGLSRKWHPDKNKAKGAREKFVVSLFFILGGWLLVGHFVFTCP